MANIRKSFNFRDGVQVDEDNFIVNSQGLVGIGTTVPAESLDVRGNINVVGVITAGNEFVSALNVTGFATITDGTFGRLEAPTSGIVTATTGILTYFGDGSTLSNLPTSQWIDTDVGAGYTSIYAAGNVGVGSTDPRFTFQVGGNTETAVGVFTGGVGINSTGNVLVSGILTANSIFGNGPGIEALDADHITKGTLAQQFLPVIDDGVITSGLNLSGIVTAGQFIGPLTGDVTGTATTAQTLTGSPDITVDDIVASTLTVGFIKDFNDLGVEGQVGVGTTAPLSNIEVKQVGLSSIYVGSTSNASVITLGRGTPSNTSGQIRFGNESTAFPYSSNKSLDVINYDTGNVNFYLEAGTAGLGTGDFHWHRRKNTARLMTLTYGGNLGLGITTPTHTLHVSGISTFTANAYFNGDVNIEGNLIIDSINTHITGNLIGNVNAASGISTFNELKVTDTISTSGITTTDRVNLGNTPQNIFKIDEFGNVGIKTDNINTNMELDVRGDIQAQHGLIVGPTASPKCAVDMSSLVDVVDGGQSRAAIAYMIPPRVTTAQRDDLRRISGGALNSSVAGATVYNTDTNKLQVWDGSSWNDCF